MSRNDSRRGSRERGSWNNRDDRKRSGRLEAARSDRAERGGKSGRNDRDRNSATRSERSEKRGFESRSYDRRLEARRQFSNPVSQKEIREAENAIKEFKENVPVCEICGQPITDIASAISNKGDGKPVHFDCVLKKITETEKPGANERVAYIGQGRFAVIYSENPHDAKHFSIRRTIEWEGRDQERSEWRNEMASLYSQVK